MNRNTLIFVMAFTMGFVIMSVELLGGKILAPYFGSSIHVWGSIITVFMLALSIGYALGGLYSRRAPDIRKFGTLFVIASILLWSIVFFTEPLGDFVFLRIEDERAGALVFCMLIFFLPTTIMGFASPYAVSLTTTSKETSGMSAGFLYFVSTIGSALGTLMTSFFFALYFETNTIIKFCSGFLFLLGIIAILQYRKES